MAREACLRRKDQVYQLLFDRTFGVIEPKREPRPGAEWSGFVAPRPRRLMKDIDHDQGSTVSRSARSSTLRSRPCRPILMNGSIATGGTATSRTLVFWQDADADFP